MNEWMNKFHMAFLFIHKNNQIDGVIEIYENDSHEKKAEEIKITQYNNKSAIFRCDDNLLKLERRFFPQT